VGRPPFVYSAGTPPDGWGANIQNPEFALESPGPLFVLLLHSHALILPLLMSGARFAGIWHQ
jgi:hypothetical protein